MRGMMCAVAVCASLCSQAIADEQPKDVASRCRLHNGHHDFPSAINPHPQKRAHEHPKAPTRPLTPLSSVNHPVAVDAQGNT
jgi:hypothetical protein